MSFAPVTTISSRTIVLPQENIDTDQIVPARFLTTTSKEGLADAAFRDWRFDAEGAPIAEHPLNQTDLSVHRILVAGANFGCGSSREHAPWALLAMGFKAVISTAIADIFKNNALGNGLLPVIVDQETYSALVIDAGSVVTIDVSSQEVRHRQGTARFEIGAFDKSCLTKGKDRLGMLLSALPDITRFEEAPR